jgi:hypothetical protein
MDKLHLEHLILSYCIEQVKAKIEFLVNIQYLYLKQTPPPRFLIKLSDIIFQSEGS